MGTITLKVKGDNELILEKIRYVPYLQRNLIFLIVLDDLKYHIIINKGYIKIFRASQLIIEAPQETWSLHLTNHKILFIPL